jgi:hypothetical protein
LAGYAAPPSANHQTDAEADDGCSPRRGPIPRKRAGTGASIFASALLMPEFLFTKRADGRLPTTSMIKDLADYFSTSLTAAAIRYVETSSDYCVFVLSEKNRIRYWRASDSFGDHNLWIDNRTTLPATSPAAAFFRGAEVPAKPEHVDFRKWLGDLEHIHADTVIEQAIPLPCYNQVISNAVASVTVRLCQRSVRKSVEIRRNPAKT